MVNGVNRQWASILMVLSTLFGVAALLVWGIGWVSPGSLSIETESAPPVSVRNPSPNRVVEIFSMRGVLDVRCYWRSPRPRTAGPTHVSFSKVSSPRRLGESVVPPTFWNRLGFYYNVVVPRGSFFMPRYPGERTSCTLIEVPDWLIAALFLAPLGWRIARARRSAPADRCHACGYNLTGNVSGKCPECGRDVSPGRRAIA